MHRRTVTEPWSVQQLTHGALAACFDFNPDQTAGFRRVSCPLLHLHHLKSPMGAFVRSAGLKGDLCPGGVCTGGFVLSGGRCLFGRTVVRPAPTIFIQ